jgi:hypothetical protein
MLNLTVFRVGILILIALSLFLLLNLIFKNLKKQPDVNIRIVNPEEVSIKKDFLFYIYRVPRRRVMVNGVEILPRNLWTIAEKHRVSVDFLKKANGLKSDVIHPGQRLIVPVPRRFRALVSWYGPKFHGRKMANGERFNQYDSLLAHPTLPFETVIKIRWAVAKVKDRGPYPRLIKSKKYQPRLFDASRGLANKIGLRGVKELWVEILKIPGGFNRLRDARTAIGLPPPPPSY